MEIKQHLPHLMGLPPAVGVVVHTYQGLAFEPVALSVAVSMSLAGGVWAAWSHVFAPNAAALKANQLAKQRADLVRQTAALVASTDTAVIDQRQSNAKVIIAGVAAALFFGGVLVAKYGDAPQPQAENISQYETAPLFDVEKMLRENNPNFDSLPLSKQETMIKEATAAFNEN